VESAKNGSQLGSQTEPLLAISSRGSAFRGSFGGIRGIGRRDSGHGVDVCGAVPQKDEQRPEAALVHACRDHCRSVENVDLRGTETAGDLVEQRPGEMSPQLDSESASAQLVTATGLDVSDVVPMLHALRLLSTTPKRQAVTMKTT